MSTTFLLDIAAQGDSLANSGRRSGIGRACCQNPDHMGHDSQRRVERHNHHRHTVRHVDNSHLPFRGTHLGHQPRVESGSNFMNTIKMLVSEGKLKQAKSVCQQEDTAVARLISKGIDKIGKPLNDISSSIENSGKLEVFALESGISRLAMISGVGPMLGFLGTVVGMVIAFQQMANAGGQVEIQDLSGGISTGHDNHRGWSYSRHYGLYILQPPGGKDK